MVRVQQVRSGDRVVQYRTLTPARYAAARVAAAGARYAVRKGADYLTKRFTMPSKRRRVTSVAKTRRRGPVSTTTGRRVRKFRKARKALKITRFMRYGSVLKYEAGGVITDPDCVYVGHVTNAVDLVGEGVMRAVYRQLLQQAGMSFESWVETPTDVTLVLQWNYYPDPATTGAPTSFSNITINLNHNANASAMYAELKNRMNLGARQLQIKTFELRSNNRAVATVKAASFKVTINSYSVLSLQNRTKAETGQAADAFDVENNPVQGRLYHCNGSGFSPRREDRVTGFTGFFGDTSNGLILARAAVNMPTETKQPPPGQWFAGIQKTSNQLIAPGIIKKSVVKHTWVGMINKWIELNKEALSDGTFVKSKSAYGKAAMLGLEKTLNTRATSEPSVDIGFEINQNHSVSGYYDRHALTGPINIINGTAVPS